MSVGRARGANILLVEDFDDNRRLLALRLRNDGYHVTEASDGEEAVEAARREPPDLVIMDLTLPVLDGLSAVYRLRQLDTMADVPIIACTAHNPEMHLRAARAVGCDEYVTKPIDLPSLKTLISRLLEEGRGTASSSRTRPPASLNPEELTTYIDGLLDAGPPT